MGNSGIDPKNASENCFVADEGIGLDVPHAIVSSGDVVSVFIQTTRVVGTVNVDGFLALGGLLHLEQGTLARTLVLTIRAQISAVDAVGTLGRDGLDVEVILHRGITGREKSLGKLEGTFGIGSSWQDFRLDVDVLHVRFPADPCPGQDSSASCGQVPVPRPNEISLVFTGGITRGIGITLEVDWLTLEPKDQPDLAWRPVLLLHGLGVTSGMMQAGTAWFEGLRERDVACHAVDLTPRGSIINNGAEVTQAVDDLRRRFGVERVHIVGHSKGGLDARQHLRHHNDVETLIMLGSPNDGSFIADIAARAVQKSIILSLGLYSMGFLEMTTEAMRSYNGSCVRNQTVKYVTAAADYDSAWAKKLAPVVGENDEIVSVASVEALSYADAWTYLTSETDPESQGICRTEHLRNHSCLRYYPRIVDDLFPAYIAVVTPPLPRASQRSGRARAVTTAGPGRARASAATEVQGLMSGAGLASTGTAASHTARIDPADGASFLVLGAPGTLRFELVSPSGVRIDQETPLVDPSITATSLRDAGSLSYAGYLVEGPEVGDWTLEVTGTGSPSPDTAYAVTAQVELPAGTGVVLAAAVDREDYTVGEVVTITATVTAAGLPVPAATVRAEVLHPDGVTTTAVVLADDGTEGDAVAGDGVYTGVFAAPLSGLHSIVVAAEGTVPAFAREQLLQVSVTPNATTFSGAISDRGVDTDGDGRFDQLLVEVGVEVAVAAAYHVFATLSDGAGTAIKQLRVEQHLEPGPQTVSLAFDGALLFALGHDGPYLLEDLGIEDVATEIGLARSPAYTTAAYVHTAFQRPSVLLTGNASDHGAHTLHMERLPFEELVVEVEVDMAVAADVEATAKLYAQDGGFVAAGNTLPSLAPGLAMVAFHFPASEIFRAGKPGPFTLQLFSIWGTTADSTPVSLQAPGVVAVTQPYRLEDFAPSPRYTVGGTVTGLVGAGLELELSADGPPGTPATTTLRRSGNGPFTFGSRLVSGNPYQVRVKTQPTNPVQVCTVTNASGTIEDANVTNVEVQCT